MFKGMELHFAVLSIVFIFSEIKPHAALLID